MSVTAKKSRYLLTIMAVLALIISLYHIAFALIPGADGLFLKQARKSYDY